MENQDVTGLLDRHKALKAARANWEAYWQELAEVLHPRRADFTATRAEGEKRTERLFDSQPMQARRGLAAAIDGLMKPKESDWFFIRASDEALNEDQEAKVWMEAAEDRMRKAIYSRAARFTQRTGEVDDDLVTFGTGVLFTGEAHDLNRLLFRAFPLSRSYIAENADGDVDTVMISERLTARQAEQRYGHDALGGKVREALRDGKHDRKFEFLWVVQPRHDRDVRRRDNRNLPFASRVVDVESRYLVSDSGFHEFPFSVPRWDTTSGELYGHSPGMIALPDANTLQVMGKTLLVAGQRAADPPLVAADDGSFSAIKTYPGGVTAIDADLWKELGGRSPVQPLHTGANIPLGREMQNDTRESIWAAFFRNVMQLPVNAPSMTATEVMERKEEFLRTIGPVFGRLEADYIGDVVERVFNVMMRAGAFPEPPEILQGEDVRFEFASPVVKARRQIEAAGAARSMELLAPFVQHDPGVMDNFDSDEIARDSRDIFGLPAKWIRPAEAVRKMREERNNAQSAMETMAGADQAAGTLEKVSRIPGGMKGLAQGLGQALPPELAQALGQGGEPGQAPVPAEGQPQ